MSCFDEVRFLCIKNIRYKFLRVTINNREPCALNLYHYPMSFFKNMIDIVKVNYKFFGFIGISGEGFEKLFLNLPRNTSIATGNW